MMGVIETIQKIPLAKILEMVVNVFILLILIAFLISPVLLSLLMPTGT